MPVRCVCASVSLHKQLRFASTCISVKFGADCVLCRISRLCNNRLSSVRFDWHRASSAKNTNSQWRLAKTHLCERRHCQSTLPTLTFGTLVHLLGLLQPGGHFALAVAVGGRQAAVAAAAGSRRLPRQAAGLRLLLGDIWLFCLNLHVERLFRFLSANYFCFLFKPFMVTLRLQKKEFSRSAAIV